MILFLLLQIVFLFIVYKLIDQSIYVDLSNQPTVSDQRSIDIHNLLMSKDTLIKELERVNHNHQSFNRIGIASSERTTSFSK